jgi:hypothetical protein
MSLADLFGIGGDGGATDTQRQALAEFDKIAIPDPAQMKIQLQKMVQQGILTPEQAQTYQQAKTGMSDITTDPNNLNAAKTALAGLTDVYQQGGLNDSDKAALGEIQDQEAQAEKGSRGAIMQNMAERGVGGSGMELAAQLENQQGAATRKATADRDVAGSAQARALQAMQAAGGLGQSLQGQEFGQKAQVATAQDAINRFNTQNSQDVQNKIIADKNAAAAANLAAKQGVANTNVNLGNEQEVANKGLIQGNFNNQMNLAGAKGGIYNNIAGIQQGQQKSKDAFTGSLIGAAANVGAAAINPYGAVKKLIPGQAKGGRIPGIPRTPGDSEMNDTIPAKLSPGEIVVPRTIARNPERAAEFVKHPPMAKSSINPEVLKMIMRKHAPAKLAAGGMLDLNQTPADELNPNIEAIMASMNGMEDSAPQGIPTISADQPASAPAPDLAPAPMPISPDQGPAPEPAPAPQDDFSPEARQAMLAKQGQPNVGQLIAKSVGGIGDAISASVGQTGKGMSGVDSVIGAQKQGALDKFAAGREDVGYNASIADAKAKADPNSQASKTLRSIVIGMMPEGKRAGMNLDGMSFNQLASVVPSVAKMVDANLSAEWHKANLNNSNTNKNIQITNKQEQLDQRRGTQFEQEMNASKQRSGAAGQNQVRLNASERALALIDQTGGNPNAMQTPELAQSIAALIGGGQGVVNQQQIENLMPQSYKGNIKKWLTKLTNEPLGLDQQAFIKSYAATAQRERAIITRQLLQAQVKSTSGYQDWIKRNPDDARMKMQAQGFPDDIIEDVMKGDYKSANEKTKFDSKLGATDEGQTGWTPEKEARLKELKAKAGK